MDDLKIIIDPCQEGTLQRNYSRSIGRILRKGWRVTLPKSGRSSTKDYWRSLKMIEPYRRMPVWFSFFEFLIC